MSDNFEQKIRAIVRQKIRAIVRQKIRAIVRQLLFSHQIMN